MRPIRAWRPQPQRATLQITQQPALSIPQRGGEICIGSFDVVAAAFKKRKEKRERERENTLRHLLCVVLLVRVKKNIKSITENEIFVCISMPAKITLCMLESGDFPAGSNHCRSPPRAEKWIRVLIPTVTPEYRFVQKCTDRFHITADRDCSRRRVCSVEGECDKCIGRKFKVTSSTMTPCIAALSPYVCFHLQQLLPHVVDNVSHMVNIF